jgi:hypothetical protein
VRFTVCSAYGFVKRFQNPNIDPQPSLASAGFVARASKARY